MQDENIKINETQELDIKSKYITIDDFLKVEIKLGTIIEVNEVEGSDKLYKLKVDFGEYREVESEGGLTEREAHTRTVFSGIRKFVNSENLLNKQFPFVTNLEPRKIMGGYSEAMILAASDVISEVGEEGSIKREVLSLMNPSTTLTNGTKLK